MTGFDTVLAFPMGIITEPNNRVFLRRPFFCSLYVEEILATNVSQYSLMTRD